MAATRTNPLFRVMPSLTDVVFLLPVVFLFTKMDGAKAMLGDGDTGWHVRTGEWILANGRVPHVDMFSFTKPGQPWFAWEWLWDIMFALIHRSWGLGGVVVASMLVISLTYMLVYKLALRRCGNPLVAVTLAALAAGGSSIHWLARPHLFSLLFMAIFLWILENVRESSGAALGFSDMTGSQRPGSLGDQHLGAEAGASVWDRWPALHSATSALWLLPILTVVWTNIHGGFFIGIILCGAYGGGELLGAVFASDCAGRKDAVKRSLKYLGAAAGCAAASLVNPYTYHLHEHIYTYLKDPFLTEQITEFQGTNFQMAPMIFFELLLAAGLGAAVWYGMRKQFTELLLIAGWGHLGLLVVRNVPVFLIVAPMVVARPLCAWMAALSEAPIASWARSFLSTLLEIGEEIVPLERPWRLHVVPAVVLAVLGLAILSPAAVGKLKPVYDPKRYPEAALASISGPGQRVFTHDEWGDYLIYRLWPQGGKVFVDGRSDFYGTKFDETYVDVMNVKYDWEKTLAGYGVNTILLPVNAALAGALKESRNWKVAFDDHESIVFRPVGWKNGRMEQVSTATNGGETGRDLTVASSPEAALKSRKNQTQGVNQ